jgi:hypothetical protein
MPNAEEGNSDEGERRGKERVRRSRIRTFAVDTIETSGTGLWDREVECPGVKLEMIGDALAGFIADRDLG